MTTRLVDAVSLADLLGTSRAYVYEHAGELGAIRLGTGPKARLRFDPDRVRDLLLEEEPGPEADLQTPPRTQRDRTPMSASGSILKARAPYVANGGARRP